MICALFPMTVYEGMSISADSINIGFAFLYTAFIFHFAYVKKASLSVKDIILLAAMTILSVFFKDYSFYHCCYSLFLMKSLDSST